VVPTLAVRVHIGPIAPFRPVYVLFHFVVHLLPLALRIWAASKSPGRHTKGYIQLDILAGIIELATIWLLVFTIAPLVWPPGLDLRWGSLGLAFLALIGTIINALDECCKVSKPKGP
jgi:hypothetical protein